MSAVSSPARSPPNSRPDLQALADGRGAARRPPRAASAPAAAARAAARWWRRRRLQVGDGVLDALEHPRGVQRPVGARGRGPGPLLRPAVPRIDQPQLATGRSWPSRARPRRCSLPSCGAFRIMTGVDRRGFGHDAVTVAWGGERKPSADAICVDRRPPAWRWPPAAASQPLTASRTPRLDMKRLDARGRRARRARPRRLLGFGLMNLESGEFWVRLGDRTFPMQSVFKLLLGAAVLAEVDAGRLRLAEVADADRQGAVAAVVADRRRLARPAALHGRRTAHRWRWATATTPPPTS